MTLALVPLGIHRTRLGATDGGNTILARWPMSANEGTHSWGADIAPVAGMLPVKSIGTDTYS